MADKQQGFVVSARKYRPESWQEVIGQQAITETLHNSITQDHMAHAYLFCGPRGVGKTTCARIFAKEINRSEDHSEDEDFSFNIFELDAASNNSVEDIRSLTDQVRIPPQVGKYKVYIIDEVHMLSKQAFNAFLKTLEEPPKHAIFILATTEKHKIIPTILSRCQIYDFNRITVNDIVVQLKKIADNEGISYEEEALHVIGQKADGAMRDALSIFDQLSSFTNQKLTYDEVLKNLHVLDYDYYFTITHHLQNREFADVLVILDSILKQGFDGHHFIGGLGSHFRDLLVCKEPKTIDLLEVGDSVKKRYLDQSQEVPADWLIDGLKLVNETDFRYRNAPNTRILLETTLLSLVSLGLEKKNDSPDVVHLPEPEEKKKLEALPKKPLVEASGESRSEPQLQPQPQVDENEKVEEAEEVLDSSESEENAGPLEDDVQSEEPENPDSNSEVLALEPTPDPSPSIKRRERRRPSTISLNIDDEIPETKKEASPEEKTEESQEPPTESTGDKVTVDLGEAWKTLAKEVLDEGKSALYSILAKQNIEDQFKDDMVTLHLAHGVDEEEFNQHRSDILVRLRELTGLQTIGLNSERIERKEEAKLFTPQDKFEYLAKQNPLLKKLKSDLDLDITY